MNDTSPEQLLIEISRKPFMSILWLGTIFITMGTVIAFGKRIYNPI
jgi:cytochrome c biogenesis factor